MKLFWNWFWDRQFRQHGSMKLIRMRKSDINSNNRTFSYDNKTKMALSLAVLFLTYIKGSVKFKRVIFPRNENNSNICFIILSTALRRGKGCDFIFLKHSWTEERQHIINDSWSMNHGLWCISPAEYHRFKAGNLWRQFITWITQKTIQKLKVWEKKLSGEK